MFFEHKQGELDANKIVCIKNAKLISDFSDKIIKDRFDRIKGYSTGDSEIKELIIKQVKQVKNNEEYEVNITSEIITIKAPTVLGALFALADLKDMAINEGILQGHYIENNALPFRAYRVYMPSRETMDVFCSDILELMLDLKYNTVILEVGGAMEYKRHPKINQKWEEFAKDMHRYSGRTIEIQRGFAWEKDSIHVDNAEGEILSQDEVRNLVEKCKYCRFNVIPEVPTMSHSDYICMAYPEFAENKQDPYPDTYCPLEPKVYDIVFDVLDEVIDVFKPTMVNIGHDELYSICLCDKCKDKDPVQLYVDDIKKIHDYLQSKGIKTCMWGEKLLDARNLDGVSICGGAGLDYIDEHGYHITSPALYNSRYYVPKDILFLNWYWAFDHNKDYDLVFKDNGLEFVYGNYTACSEFERDWQLAKSRGIKGFNASNWGSFKEEYMQVNQQYIALFGNAYVGWNEDYSTENRIETTKKIAKIVYDKKKIEKGGDIEIIHTTKDNRPTFSFYDGLFIDDKYHIGHYEATFESGKKANFEVVYYVNISGDQNKIGYTAVNRTIGFNLAFEENGRTYYKTFFKNPYPGEKITNIKFVKKDKDYPYDIEFRLV